MDSFIKLFYIARPSACMVLGVVEGHDGHCTEKEFSTSCLIWKYDEQM